MIQNVIRLSAASVALVAVGLVGTASAQSAIGMTGPNSTNVISTSSSNTTNLSNLNNVNTSNSNNQSAMSGSVSGGGNTLFALGNGWTSWNPMMWEHNGQGFSAWWTGMMAQLGSMNSLNWGGSGQNNSWTPSSANWQSNWSMWNPMMWQQNGASYSDWYGHFMQYMNSNCGMWQNSWMGGIGGNLSSGSASNYNNTGNNIEINNNGGYYYPDTSNAGNGQATIYLTGPNSTNVIDENSSDRYSSSNANNVTTNNENNQQAYSGNVNESDNTFGGNASSGPAYNQNNTENNVSISNGNGGGEVGQGYSSEPSSGFIGLTGPGSNNRISSRNSNSYSSSNTNNVYTTNANTQYATSGNVSERDNTFGGSASSGSAYNSNQTDNEYSINNN